MDRGYQHSLTSKLLSEISKLKTHRNWKSSLLKQNSKEERDTLPFVTQYQPLSVYYKRKSGILIQNHTLLCQIFKEPPIISYKKGKSWQRAS